MKILLLILILLSCSSPMSRPTMGKKIFNYQDVSGSYRMIRETKIIKKKLVSRTQLFASTGGAEKLVEKSIVVSQLGTIKSRRGRTLVVRPLASEFSVWLEGKLYFSKTTLVPAAKSMRILMKSPESKWNGTQDIKFPKGAYFCYYAQAPECLAQNQLLERAFSDKDKNFGFYMVWDSFPYTGEQFANVSGSFFAPATIKYDGLVKGMHRFEIEAEGQMLLYYFSKSFEFVKMSWIAQGLTMSPLGDSSDEEEE